jgi:TonB family protein
MHPKVVVELSINAHGRVTDVRVLKGMPFFDDAAIEAARQWLYRPVRLDGKAIPVVISAIVDF